MAGHGGDGIAGGANGVDHAAVPVLTQREVHLNPLLGVESLVHRVSHHADDLDPV